MAEFIYWDAIENIANTVNSGSVTAESNVLKSLEAIELHQEYNSVIAVIKDRSIERAKEIDELVKSGKRAGRLAGVPFIAKDNFLTFGSETTAASNILKGFRAPYQATAIERLEAEGAICVAKANLDAFAHGSSTENSDYFTTLNPHDKSKVPGGSSGGSAAAVILGLAPFALGTDTGGSIRLPASFCGAVGLKPSYGLVSRSGVVAMASSTDVIGPITKDVADAALVLDVLAGKDGLDSTMIDREADYTDISGLGLKGIKIGLPKEYFGEGIDAEVSAQIKETVARLKELGAEFLDVSIPSLPLSLAVYYVVVPAEVSSNLSRYDGQRYGHQASGAEDLVESYENSRSEGFGDEAKRRIMMGTFVLSSGYYDAYFKKAAQVRTKLINEFNDVMKKVDFLLGPTAPMTAFGVGENVDDPLKMYLTDIMTVAANLLGVPAISIPCGKAGNGMPIGLQLIAPNRADKKLLSLAQKCEAILK